MIQDAFYIPCLFLLYSYCEPFLQIHQTFFSFISVYVHQLRDVSLLNTKGSTERLPMSSEDCWLKKSVIPKFTWVFDKLLLLLYKSLKIHSVPTEANECLEILTNLYLLRTADWAKLTGSWRSCQTLKLQLSSCCSWSLELNVFPYLNIWMFCLILYHL